jgi:MarR family transcriptional regulator, temperature-dependent positive regulator of motility
VAGEAVAAVRAWTRLDQAIAAFNRVLERDHGVTGAQLAVLRLVREWGPRIALADLRERLVMHPATLGQMLDRLAARGLVTIVPNPADRRRRLVELTTDGRELTEVAPLAGPVRLRHEPADSQRLRRLAAAFDDAILLFGLEEYDHDRAARPAEHRPGAGGGPDRGGRAGRGDAAGARRGGGGAPPG